MAVLARVTEDLDQPRGPDVMFSVDAPAEWFRQGASLEVRLPRLVFCARCEGGGCDLCERRGAFEQAASGAPELVHVTLPEQATEVLLPVRLRLPGCGARDTSEAGLPNGHLLLTLLPRALGAEQSPLLSRLDASRGSKSRARIWALPRALAKLLTRWLSH